MKQIKNLALGIQPVSRLMRSTLLALCLTCAIATGAHGQLAYNFQPPDDIPASTSGTHPNILTMDCLAANGYGQWTSSSSTTNTNGAASCFLLANKLNVQSSSVVTDAAEGILAAKQFNSSGNAYPNEAIKCAANLKGNVRYVWMDNSSGRTKFYVEGFDPATTTNASTGIGIDFVDLGQSSGTNSQKIVKDGSAILYGEVTIPASGTLVTTTNEALYPDMFDIAIDASNLYIVWEQYNSGTYTIKAMAVNLTGTFSPTFLGLVGTGRRPTVAVDVRHSGSIADIDVAYINSLPGGQVEWTEYNGTSFPASVPVPNPVTGKTWSWINATHARIIDASTPGSGTTDKAIYFIAQDNSGNVSLYFNRITSGAFATTTDYCDGQLNTDRGDPGSPYVCPVETTTAFDVLDDYIRAFINPYDGSNTSGAFNHFNCLYVLNRTSGTSGGKYPIMIIQGSDPDSGYCVSGGSTLGNFPYDDPVKATTNWPFEYVGAANQMGIHVHWTGLNTSDHYYRRDAHAIDQNIEENTLLTSTCEVAGSVTLTNKWLTLYSDPADASHNGYTGGGVLTIDNSTTLDINPSGAGGDFAAVGPELIDFTTTGSIIAVESDDQMDFYGGDHSAINGVGEFRLTGTGDGESTSNYGTYVASILHPATLNIHGGTALDVGITGNGASYFTCADAIIHFNSETNVMTGTGASHGALILNNHSSFTTCELISDDGGSSSNPTIIIIAANGSGGSGTGNADYNTSYSTATYATDTFTECMFTTNGNTGHATISIGDPNVAPNALTIDKGIVEGISFSAKSGLSPYWPISITDVTFERTVQFGVDFSYASKPSEATTMLYSTLIDGCGFEGFDDLTNFSNPDGIKIEAAPDVTPSGGTPDDHLREAITITNNTFEGSTPFSEPDGSVEAAIYFSDATGDIGYNIIGTTSQHAPKFQRGIWNESSTASSNDLTWSLICGNNIVGLTHANAAGLSTDYYIGYAKLNTIKDGYISHVSDYQDYDNDLSSYYTGNSSYGYVGSSNSQGNLTGVHQPSDPSIDVAGYSIIKSNNSGGTQISLTGTAIVYLGLEPFSPTWPTTAYGLNDIEGTTDICSASGPLGDISNNYWGSGAYSLCTGTTASGGYLTTAPGSSGFVCSDGLISHKKSPITQSMTDLPDTTCTSLIRLGYGLVGEGPGAEPGGYDTLRLFCEQCPFWTDTVSHSWDALEYTAGAVSEWTAGGAGRWPNYLNWLKKVLYLNPDTMWYCTDVGNMITAEQADFGMKMAELKYLLDNNRCPGFRDNFVNLLHYDSINQHQQWLDSIVAKYDTEQPDGKYQWWLDSMVNKDTMANPFDSTIPSLQQVDLEILLGPQNSVQGASSPLTQPALLDATLLDNPMQDEIDVSFEMGRSALITMELRDILGRSVPLTFAKYQFEQPGTHSARIPVPNLPPGTYYLRITTDTGDVITLKVVKQ